MSDYNGTPKKAQASADTNRIVTKAQRHAYMSTKGISPGAQHQLDLLFPDSFGREDLRHIPNDLARSSVFTARNRNEARRNLTHEALYHYNEHVSIVYTGIELRAEDDELVWLQILRYGDSVPLGEPFEFNIRDLVRDLDWAKNGRNYDRARESLSRLKANELLVKNTKAYGTSGSLSLIQNYTSVNDDKGKPTHYRVWIHPSLITLLAGNTITSHKWSLYRGLTPVARRLADYVASHKHPYPLSVDTFRGMCGSANVSPRSWRQVIKKACAELIESGLVKHAGLDDNDRICAIRD